MFANHMTNVFQPFRAGLAGEEGNGIMEFLGSPYQMSLPIAQFNVRQVKLAILELKLKKRQDMITAEVLRQLPSIGIRVISLIFNAILRLGIFPSLWKVAQIILIAKRGKPTLKPWLLDSHLIQEHQFGFRERHGTAAFLDISQAFDRVWHGGLLYKIKKCFPHEYYVIFKPYLTGRYFQVKHKDEVTSLRPILSGVPQGSVSGHLLYLIFTAVLASHQNRTTASQIIQSIEHWFRKWRISANETKSVNVTYTMRRQTCPLVTLNGSALPPADEAKYLGMHLDRRLTWKKHITTKRKQLGLTVKNLHWLMGRYSSISFHPSKTKF
ncbi:PREDICTED: RNA-directed DNA polymerase from mobile element jockey-like [Nicrophorus vespilloides]|uniref:RNA-directed DNA polymerase from mobile element jockey-like n=1 Tax=Nicrophorus vespilloides TaxID=110193 RepID=A0ABM1M225_NICVS|nr:PREDICTED: RNA-directed DNA polymerase from mobile element jockey-like [Nicrophorus vespilloides]